MKGDANVTGTDFGFDAVRTFTGGRGRAAHQEASTRLDVPDAVDGSVTDSSS